MALRSVGITNIVRLAKDDFDFYFDEQGRDNDLKEAMERFRLETDRYEAELFDSLYLVVEHEDEIFKYLVEIEIQRLHKVGVYPITLTANAVATDFALKEGEDVDAVKDRLQPVFRSQSAYDEFRVIRQERFDQLLQELKLSVAKYIKTDAITLSANTQVIRPEEPLSNPDQMRHDRRLDGRTNPPIFHGYYGFDPYFYYAWMWSEMSYHNHIYYHDVSLVDPSGHQILSVGADGFDAGESQTLNPEAPFEAPPTDDITVHNDHAYSEGLAEAGYTFPEVSDQETDKSGSGWFSSGSSWLSSSGDSSDSSDSSSSDSGSSDSGSSCSSCGGKAPKSGHILCDMGAFRRVEDRQLES